MYVLAHLKTFGRAPVGDCEVNGHASSHREFKVEEGLIHLGRIDLIVYKQIHIVLIDYI